MESSYDVVIVGGAAVGSAAAYFLKGPLGFKGSVLVVERDPTYAEAATPRSGGGVRQQFSVPENIRMSQFGMAFVKSVAEHLTVDGEAPALGLVEAGYLFLAKPDGLAMLQANLEVQRGLGADIVLLDPAGIAARFPYIKVDDLAGGSFGLSNEGWIDPHALLQGFRRKARALGATYAQDEVVAFERRGAPANPGARLSIWPRGFARGARIEAVRLKSGARVACGTAINAAGTRAHLVAQMAGVDIPVRPKKRITYVIECRTPLPRLPLTIDATGVYVRPEKSTYLCGVSPPEDNDPDCLDFEIDYAPFEEIVWPALAHRIPAFEALKLARAWACHYDYNLLDQNAIIGPHPDCPNFLLCNGFSGHGLQQSPAAGRALAELVVHGRFVAIDLSRLGYGRVLKNAPLTEANVV